MQQFDLAYLVHRTPTRIRLRIPSRHNDLAFFAGLQRQLLACEGTIDVETSAITASLVITAQRGFDWSSLHLADFGLAIAHHAPGGPVSPSGIAALRVSTRLTPEGIPGQRTPADHRRGIVTDGDLDVPGLAVQFASVALARQPALALAQWAAEAMLRFMVRCLLAPKT